MAEDTDKKDGPQFGAHRQTAPQPAAAQPEAAPQAWVPAKPTQMAADTAPVGGPVVGGTTTTTVIHHTSSAGGDEKKKMTAEEKLQAGVSGILAGNGGLKEGQMIGEAVGEGIKRLFGQGQKSGAPAGPGQPVVGKPEGGPVIGGEKAKTVGQMLGKVASNVAGQVANLAVDHARGIGGGIGSAIGSAIAGDKGAAVGKDLGKNLGSGVKSVRDGLAEKGIKLGEKPQGGKHSHGVK